MTVRQPAAEAPASTEVLRVLIVKTTSLGDVIHTLPVVADLLRLHPDAQVDWLVEEVFAAIPRLHPGVRRVITQSWRLWRRRLWQRATWRAMAQTRRSLRAQRYDLVIDFQGLIKSGCWAVQAPGTRVGYAMGSARESLACCFYDRWVEVSTRWPAVERNRRLMAGALGTAFDAGRPAEFGLPDPVDPGWRPSGARYAVLIPSASRPGKRWPLRHWSVLGQRLRTDGMSVVVLWGLPHEQAVARQLADMIDAEASPPLALPGLAALVGGASMAVGLDTGFSHLAAAYGVPAVALFCDSDPALAGLTGPGPSRSLGGKGQSPSLEDVLVAVREVLGEAAQAQSSSTQRGG